MTATLKSHYPEFVPNQILTNTQLNQLRDHLERQDLWTRMRLTGTGIVCGLGWSVEGASHIELKGGYGVTSDGEAVEHAATTFTHTLPYDDPGKDEEGELEYGPWRDAANPIAVLLDDAGVLEHEDPQNPPQALAAGDLQDHVLVLYLERRPQDLRSCIVTDCNNTGTNIHVCVRALLVHRDDLTAVTACPPPPAMVRLPRFHTATRPTELASAADIDATWGELVNAALPDLVQDIQAAFDAQGTFLDLDLDIISRLQALEDFIGGSTELHQLHHDFLADLACALNEAVTAACELRAECCPASTFPRHLMLGDLEHTDPFTDDPYRQTFQPAPARDVLFEGFERTRRLFLRLAAMLDAVDESAFERTGEAEIRLTPSRTTAEPLGRRAVPRYFALSAAVERHWQPRLCCTTEPLWSYHSPGAFDNEAKGCDLVRVEGHLGLGRDAAVEVIEALRRQHNVPFEVLCARFGDPASESEPFHEHLLERIEERFGHLRSVERVLFLGASEGTIDDAQVSSGVRETSEVVRQIVDEIRERFHRLNDFKLWCDPAPILTAFRAARRELVCRLHRLLGELGKTPDFFDSEAWEPGEVPAARARVMLADRRLIGLLLIGAVDGDVEGEVETLREEIEKLTEDVAPWVLLAPAADALRRSTERLVSRLPEHPGLMGVEVFIEQVRQVHSDALYLWLLWKASDDLPEDLPIGIGREDDPGDALLPVLSGCEPARLVELTLAYEALRQGDLSWFSSLATAVDGLEHSGGVEKCGTFVLVADEGDVVTADFSVPCRPPCCCSIDMSSICRPPMTLPDYRIVVLEPGDGGFASLDLSIDVLTNDLDNNHPPRRMGFSVHPDDDTSMLGARLNPAGNGLIRYRHDDPRPGCVDRVRYSLSLSGDECSGQAIGELLILTVATPEPEPGAITGRVASREGDAPIFGAEVKLIETGQATSTDEGGRYDLPDVDEGVYELEFSHPEFESVIRTAAVTAGETTAVDAVLEPVAIETGSVLVTVREAETDAKPPILGAQVRLQTPSGDLVASGTTLDNGEALLESVPVGSYVAVANADGFKAESGSVQVEADTRFDLTLLLVRELLTVVVEVQNSKGQPVPGIEVFILCEEPHVQRTGFTDNLGEVTFTEMPPGYYMADASSDGVYLGGTSDQVDYGSPNRLTIIIESFFNDPDQPFLTRVAASRETTTSEAAKAITSLYTERQAGRVEAITTLEATLPTSKAYQNAVTFLQRTVLDPSLGEQEVTAACQDTLRSLNASIVQVDAERQAALREAVALVVAACLDRLSFLQPETLDPQIEADLAALADLTRKSGVTSDQVLAIWDGNRLKNELGMTSIDGIQQILGGTA